MFLVLREKEGERNLPTSPSSLRLLFCCTSGTDREWVCARVRVLPIHVCALATVPNRSTVYLLRKLSGVGLGTQALGLDTPDSES